MNRERKNEISSLFKEADKRKLTSINKFKLKNNYKKLDDKRSRLVAGFRNNKHSTQI